MIVGDEAGPDAFGDIGVWSSGGRARSLPKGLESLFHIPMLDE